MPSNHSASFARGLQVTPEQRELVVARRDVATLDRWLRLAATAPSAAELYSR
jgi:hypothetical protein